MDILKELLALFGFGPENLQALLYISLASVFIPQVAKKSTDKIKPELVACISGLVSGLVFLSLSAKGGMVGLVLGAFWTAAYKPIMRVLYKYWPELEEKVSAKPQKLVQTPDGLELRDADVVSGKNEETQLYVVTVPKEKRDGDSK
jgi:hypothetical protein